MSMFCDYFAAGSDEDAGAAIGGVVSGETDVVSAKGIDPLVQLGTLEELLTGRPFDDICAGPRSGVLIKDGGDGERVVVSVTDELCTALADASDERLAQVAVPWSQTEEFFGEADPEQLAEVLGALAALAQRARAAEQRLFCLVSV
jgi:hypothetical protein